MMNRIETESKNLSVIFSKSTAPRKLPDVLRADSSFRIISESAQYLGALVTHEANILSVMQQLGLSRIVENSLKVISFFNSWH